MQLYQFHDFHIFSSIICFYIWLFAEKKLFSLTALGLNFAVLSVLLMSCPKLIAKINAKVVILYIFF